MEGPTQPHHFVRSQISRSKQGSNHSSRYPYPRERPSKLNSRPKHVYESPDYPYPTYMRRVIPLVPVLDKHVMRQDDDDDDDDGAVVKSGSEDAVEAERIKDHGDSVHASISATKQSEITGFRTPSSNSNTKSGAKVTMYLKPILRSPKSEASSVETEAYSSEKKDTPVRKRNTESGTTAHPLDSKTTKCQNNNDDILIYKPGNIDGEYRSADLIQNVSLLPIHSTPTIRAKFGQTQQQTILLNHNHNYKPRYSCFELLNPTETHIRNIEALNLITQTTPHLPLNRKPATQRAPQPTPLTNTAQLQRKYTQLASQIAMNLDMQAEDQSVLAAGGLYPQHVRLHVSQELEQLQVQEQALLKAIKDIKAVMQLTAKQCSVARVRSLDREDVCVK